MARTVQPTDRLPSKIAKYVPVEMVALASGYFAAFGTRGLWWALGVGALLNAAYMVGVRRAGDPGDPGDGEDGPPPSQRTVMFPLLSSTAFLLWALATIPDVGEAASLSIDQRAWLLSATTLTLPLLDGLLSSFRPAVAEMGQ